MAQKTAMNKNLQVRALSIRLPDNVLRHPHMTSRINLFRSQQARNSSSNAQQAGPKKLISPHVSHSSCFVSQSVIDQDIFNRWDSTKASDAQSQRFFLGLSSRTSLLTGFGLSLRRTRSRRKRGVSFSSDERASSAKSS